MVTAWNFQVELLILNHICKSKGAPKDGSHIGQNNSFCVRADDSDKTESPALTPLLQLQLSAYFNDLIGGDVKKPAASMALRG